MAPAVAGAIASEGESDWGFANPSFPTDEDVEFLRGGDDENDHHDAPAKEVA